MLLVAADPVQEVVQVAGGEFPAERPGGLVVVVHEAQQGGGELTEAGEVVGVTTFFWMTEKKISINRPWEESVVMSGFWFRVSRLR